MALFSLTKLSALYERKLRKAMAGTSAAAKLVLHDGLAPIQAHLLALTLKPYITATKSSVNTLTAKPGDHFVYFNHAEDERDLGPDGYDQLQAPAQKDLKARRWASGRIEFCRDRILQLGTDATCEEVAHNLQGRPGRAAVEIYRTINQSGDWVIREKRTLAYFSDRSLSLISRIQPIPAPCVPQWRHRINLTSLLLFRYSALTFNAHKIHYDPVFAASERLDGIIAQGPLLVTLALRWFTDQVLHDKRVQSFEYRNLASLVAGTDAEICAAVTQKSYDLWIQNSQGVVLRGTVVVA